MKRGLKWRADGELLASGGNDNVVNVWDGRVGDVHGRFEGGCGEALKLHRTRNRSTAVKVLYHVFILFNSFSSF